MSVPVRRQEPSSPDSDDAGPASSWVSRPGHPEEPGRDNHKPSVIVTRRRSLRNSLSDSPDQVGAPAIIPLLSGYLLRLMNLCCCRCSVFPFFFFFHAALQHSPLPHWRFMSPLPPFQFSLSLSHVGGVVLSQIKQIIRIWPCCPVHYVPYICGLGFTPSCRHRYGNGGGGGVAVNSFYPWNSRQVSLGSNATSFIPQNGGTEGEKDDDGKKSKRRPRPEPLFIPPPKPSVFIAPPVYSSITPYQSHLRSPVRLADNPLTMPPYTPPPILSPVREGSGLYFSTFLSSAASSQGLPPPATPKSATRSLLRTSECKGDV